MSWCRDRGSAFLDAVIASAILAAAFITLLQVTTGSAVRTRSAEVKRAGLLVAESRLAGVGTEIPLRPGVTVGEEGALLWRVEIAPFTETRGEVSAAGEVMEVEVRVRARDGNSDAVVLRSMRLASRG